MRVRRARLDINAIHGIRSCMYARTRFLVPMPIDRSARLRAIAIDREPRCGQIGAASQIAAARPEPSVINSAKTINVININ